MGTSSATASLAISLALSASAVGDVVYDFEGGTCSSGCTGAAIGTLTLTDDYVPGVRLYEAN